jgi:hypothetical protein
VIQLPKKHRHFSETFWVMTAVLLGIQVAWTLRRVGGKMVPDVSKARRIVVKVVCVRECVLVYVCLCV